MLHHFFVSILFCPFVMKKYYYFKHRYVREFFIKSSSVIGRKTRQGFPTAITFAGISLVTALLAPITLPSPIVTPGKIVTSAPIQTLSPIVIGFAISSP